MTQKKHETKTLLQRMGFADPDLGDPLHTEIIHWIDTRYCFLCKTEYSGRHEMNGAPIPPDPAGPPDWFLFVLFVIGIVFMFTLVFIAEDRERRRKAIEDKQEVLAETLAQEKENLENYRIQVLINQSPGGRKPWQ